VPDQTNASIDIAAPADEIMGVIADFDSYPEWVDDMKSAEVLTYYDDGWAKTVRITLDHALVKDVYVLEYDWVENVASWKGTAPRRTPCRRRTSRGRRTPCRRRTPRRSRPRPIPGLVVQCVGEVGAEAVSGPGTGRPAC
jgi:hypothetical protein